VTVGANNTPCDETALRNAILNPPGGTITFSSGAAVVHIQITQPIPVGDDIDVDGGRRVRFDAAPGFAGTAFTVVMGVSLKLQGLNLAQFNAGTLNGGAPVNNRTVTLERVGVIGNHAGSGGAIYSTGILSGTDSTLSGNTATNGAAVYNTSGAAAKFVNSTLSGSSAVSNGGGLYNEIGATADFQSTTLYLNNATLASGVYKAASGASITAHNSIFAVGRSPQCIASITSNGYNLESSNSCGFSAALHYQTSTPPQRGQIQNNGGFTSTHLPSPASPFSPAIDAGDPGDCPAPYHFGNVRPFGVACDIGSVENQIPPHVFNVATNGSDLNNTCNLRSCPCKTINRAIGAAQSGDAVFVGSGTYKSNDPQRVPVADVSKGLSLSGRWDPTFSTEPKNAMSMINGQYSRRGLVVEAGITAKMSRFVVQRGGHFQFGGGAYVAGTLQGRAMVFGGLDGNLRPAPNAAACGGALYVASAPVSLDLEESGVYGNGAKNGGGLFVAGGSSLLQNVTLANNDSCAEGALGGPTYGGGVCLQTGTV